MASCRPVLLSHPESLCPARLPLASQGPGRGVRTWPELLGTLDSSSLGLTLNLQLSTFNRVSFPFSRLSLSQRSSKSFIIRTSMTPLPQLLYNPHLQAPLGSAGNKGLITPLESALTKNSPVTPVESALTKRERGWGPSRAFHIQTFRSGFHSSPLFSYHSKLFCTFLHLPKTQLFCSQAIPNSLCKTPGCGGGAAVLYLKKDFKSLSSRMHDLSDTWTNETSGDYLPFRLSIGSHKNFSIDQSRPCREDPDPVGTVDREPSVVSLPPHGLVDRRAFAGHNFHSAPLLGVTSTSEEGE